MLGLIFSLLHVELKSSLKSNDSGNSMNLFEKKEEGIDRWGESECTEEC